jgi:hypothetical protein
LAHFLTDMYNTSSLSSFLKLHFSAFHLMYLKRSLPLGFLTEVLYFFLSACSRQQREIYSLLKVDQLKKEAQAVVSVPTIEQYFI